MGKKNNKQLTIFNKMNLMFGPDGVNVSKDKTNRYSLDSKELIRTKSKEEYDTAKSQAMQNKYLSNTWKKVDNEMFQQSIHYETTRIGSYSDFESMEFFPEIAAALDVLMEESVTPNEKGVILNVHSESKRVKEILNDLFVNRLELHTTLPVWTRNVPIKYDSIIPLLNGEDITIKELSDRVKSNPDKDIWTYAIQDDTLKVVPGKIVWCDLTRKDSELIRVNLDNETYIDTTPDHEYILRDGSSCRADKLTPGISLMPFYTKKSKERNIKGYEKIFNPNTNRYEYTHRIVANELLTDELIESESSDFFLTHHVNFNKLNNDPGNLKRMTFKAHAELHSELGDYLEKYRMLPDVIEKRLAGIDKYLRSDERKKYLSEKMLGVYPQYFKEYNNSVLHNKHNKIRSDYMGEAWGNPEFVEKTKKGMTIVLSDEAYSKIINTIINENDYLTFPNLVKQLKKDKSFIESFIQGNTIKRDLTKSINNNTLRRIFKRKSGVDYLEFIKTIKPELINNKLYQKHCSISKTTVVNHKVLSVVRLTETADVFCMEVQGPNGEGDRHNFPVNTKDVNGNHTRDGVFLSNCKYGDNFVFLNIDDKAGVIGSRQMPNIEIERREGDLHAALMNRMSSEKSDNTEYESRVKFFWKTRDIEFNSWQMAHFRLFGDDRKLPYGTCLKYNTRVETELGYKEIKDIEKGDLVYTFDTETQRKVLSLVLDTISSGIKQNYKLSTQHNFIDVSKEHKIMFYNTETNEFDYKHTLDFKIGDLLVVDQKNTNKNIINIDKATPVENKNGWWNNNNLIPDAVDEEFARLFGHLIGDGWISDNNVSFALSEHKSINDRYINTLEKYSGKKIRFDGSRVSQAMVGSKLLKTILKRMDFNGDVYTKRIPSWVYSASIEVRKAFLDGLIDADGSLFIDKWDCMRYSIELTNEELINDVKILVQSLGMKSGKISNRLRKNGGIGDRKFKTQQRSFSFYFFESDVNQKKKYDIGNRITNDYIIEPIKTIEESGEHETYDIYVENDNHNFYANGVVVHNSTLEKARRIWKQLLLSEDAMLVYRVTRAPERRIYKVYVGNMDDGDIEAYVNSIADRFKRAPVIDPQTGQIDLRYNQMGEDQDIFVPVRDENANTPIDTLPGACLALDTRIPLLDGRTLELNEIINEWDNGNRNLWVYSVNPETGESAPGQITWAGETRKNTETLTITLDNGEKLTTTPDHKWVHRTKGFVEAQDLVVGDSLMPFYRDTKKILNQKYTNEYERIWDTAKQAWVFTHRMVTDFMGDKIKEFTHDVKYLNEDKLYNHKIIKIEIGEVQDTGTITVDGEETLHMFHTFACESGVYVKNSNLDAIADIVYLQNKLFTALRIPKPFLGFDETAGDGKNLAIQDIRFARTINRIQQSMIMELNKIAIIHLYLLGFDDELNNFTLTLNNPSTQAEMLKVEHLQQKISLYQTAVADAGNGFAAMSMTRAKKDILQMSNDEIKQDLLEQRIEKAAAAELAQTSAIIKKTGYFDTVDNIYGDQEVLAKIAAGEDIGGGDEEGGGDDFGGGGGFGGGGDFGGDDMGDMDDMDDMADEGGDMDDMADEGGDMEETVKKTKNILTERKQKLLSDYNMRTLKHQRNYMDKLLSMGKEDPKPKSTKLTNESVKFNDNMNNMIDLIDDYLDKEEK